MATKWNNNGQRVDEYTFYPEDITIKSELNGRHDLPNIDGLVASILAIGQKQPVLIRKDGNDPVLAAGFSRWRAIDFINKHKLAPTKMRLRCVVQPLSELQGFEANIAENRMRNATTPMDDAQNIQRMLNVFGRTEDEIATVYFPEAKTDEEKKKAVTFVRRRLSLINLVPEAAKALSKGDIKPTAAEHLAKLSQEQQKSAMSGKTGKIKGKDVVGSKVSDRPTYKTVKTALEQVIETGKFAGLRGKVEASDDLVHFLSEVLGMNRKKATVAARKAA
jgi:ParB/RepB/Spo0J family partition protein